MIAFWISTLGSSTFIILVLVGNQEFFNRTLLHVALSFSLLFKTLYKVCFDIIFRAFFVLFLCLRYWIFMSTFFIRRIVLIWKQFNTLVLMNQGPDSKCLLQKLFTALTSIAIMLVPYGSCFHFVLDYFMLFYVILCYFMLFYVIHNVQIKLMETFGYFDYDVVMQLIHFNRDIKFRGQFCDLIDWLCTYPLKLCLIIYILIKGRLNNKISWIFK